MQIVRTFQEVRGRRIIIDLPDNFSAKEVEIIVLPYKEASSFQGSDAWKEDFRSVSQWDITEEDTKVRSWNIEKF